MTEANGQKLVFTEDEIKHIPLADIFVDSEWNARSHANTVAEAAPEGDGESAGIGGLATSISIEGQDTPVVVRPTTGGFYSKKGAEKPYALVAGFRRFEAIKRINADSDLKKQRAGDKKTLIPNTADGTIRAVVRNLDEKAARLFNGRENSNRIQLDTPDMMFEVHRLAGPPLNVSPSDIAASLGLTLGWAQTLVRVSSTLEKAIFAHWRLGGSFDDLQNAAVRATFSEVSDIAKLPVNEQRAAYREILLGKDAEKDQKEWWKSQVRKAEAVGEFLGVLEKEGVISVTEMPWIDALPHLIKLHKTTKEKNSLKRKLADKVEEAYQEALNREETEKDDVQGSKKSRGADGAHADV